MVAEKVISTLTESVCPVSETVTLAKSLVNTPANKFDGVKTQDLESGKTKESHENGLDNFCEVVVSYRCKFCTFVANDRNSIKRHVQDVHSSPNKNGQVNGDAPDPSVINEEAANGGHNSDGVAKNNDGSDGAIFADGAVYPCVACQLTFTSEDQLQSHMSQVHMNYVGQLAVQANIKAKEDEVSSGVPSQKRKLIRNQKTSDEKVEVQTKKARPTLDADFMCKLCKIKFKTYGAMECHEKCHIALSDDIIDESLPNKKGKNYVKGYVCCFCTTEPCEKFLTWVKCAIHLWKNHSVDCDLYNCTECPYKTPMLARLKDHELLHGNVATFTCSTCKKSFKQYKQLKTHEKYHKNKTSAVPSPTDSRWYTPKECPVCNRILSDSKCLKKHISAVHNKMKPYACHICGHTSARKAELQLHVRQHTGEKPYKCPQCPFTTGDHNCLRKHKLRHKECKPYECPYCEYSAIQAHAFKKHVLAVHPDQDVVFVCPFCSLVSVNEKLYEAHCKDHEEGRIPDDTMAPAPCVSVQKVKDAERSPTENHSDGQDSQQSSGKFWLTGEDSMEVLDTGGITIPAESSRNGANRYSQAESVSTLSSKLEIIGREPNISAVEGSISENAMDCADLPSQCVVSVSNGGSSENLSSIICTSSTDIESSVVKSSCELKSLAETIAVTHAAVDVTRTISIVTDITVGNDSNNINPYLTFDSTMSDSIDLPDILCNDHSNDANLEKLLNMNVTGFS